MKTILVTGGAGFIGSNFVHHLWENYPDSKIIVLDLLTYAGSTDNFPVNPQDTKNERFQFWFGDVCNSDLVDSLVSQCDAVVHFAAESHVTRSIYDNYAFFKTDVMGTHAIANSVLKHRDTVKRFIHISTSEVYGTAESPKMGEEHPLQPLSPYAAAKCGADRLVWSYVTTYDIPAVIVRPFNNYGPRQHLEKLVPRFITSVLLNEKLTVHGQGHAARDYVHVKDNCRAIDAILRAPLEKVKGKIFNVGTEKHISILEIARDTLREMGGNPDSIEFTGERPGQVTRHTADTSLLRKTLGWEPKISWQEGLQETVRWYRQNPDWWKKQVWMRRIPIVSASGQKELH